VDGHGDTLPDLRTTTVERRVGPYLIEGTLGRGSMGVVCRAVADDGTKVALKMMVNVFMTREEMALRFQREAEVRIDHPNVVRVLGAGTTDEGVPYIAFELLEGEPLDARFARGVTPGELRELGIQVCRGLAAAHSKGIVHRDLKPANLFACRDGTLKIVDFGIAYVQASASRLTRHGMIIGTPSYLSPEQASGHRDVDGRADLWALGAILYEGLVGHPPFDRDTALATIVAVVRDELPPLDPSIEDGGLYAIVQRALQKRPSDRFPDAEAFARALEAVHPVGTARGPSRPPSPPRGDENRIVAVLLAEGVRDPGWLERAVADRGGDLIRLVGDRALGVFGSETSAGDEATRALEAAIECRAAVFSVAVAAGRARRSDAGLSGGVLAVAEMGCAASLPGIAIDVATARSLGSSVRARRLDDRLCEVARPGRSQPSEPPPRPIVGRAAEVAQLERAVRSALDEKRPVRVLITGPPGIGKSRLRQELERLLTDANVELLSSRGVPNRRPAAWTILGSAIHQRLANEPPRSEPQNLLPDAASTMRDTLRGLAGLGRADDAEAATAVAFLGELLSIHMPETPVLVAARRDPEQMSDGLRLALRDLLEGMAGEGPLAVVLDNAQWADPESIGLLGDLAERMGDRALFLVLVGRPELLESRAIGESWADAVRLELRGLLPADATTLANAVAGRALAPELLARLVERTAGNPLFIEQIAAELPEDADARTELPLPLTVEAAIQARLDALPPAEKEVCKRAAVFGRAVSAREIEAIGIPEAAERLASLARRDLLTPRTRGEERSYGFRNALVADVAFRMLTDEQRRDLHRAVASALALSPQPDDEEIAAHHEQGGEAAAAGPRYAAAALRAYRMGDAQGVLRCADRAIALGLPDPDSFELEMARHDVLRFLARRPEQGQAVERAVLCASTDAERARALSCRSSWLSGTGRVAEAVSVAREAVGWAERCGEAEGLVRSLGQLGASLVRAGQFPAARDVLDRAEGLAAGLAPAVRAFLVEWQANASAAAGDLGRRLTAQAQAVELYREAGDLRRTTGAECNVADAYNRVGAHAEAERALRAALEGCRRVGNRMMEGYALLNLGHALAMLGRPDEALQSLREAHELALAAGDPRLAVVAEVYLARWGSLPSSEEMETAATRARDVRFPTVEAMALTLGARASLAAGDLAGARAFSERALALRDREGGLEEDEADVFLIHAEVLAALGQSEESREVLARGRAEIQRVAEGISEPRWRESFLRLPSNHRLLGG